MPADFNLPLSFCYKDFQLWNYVHLPKNELLKVLSWRNLYRHQFVNTEPISVEKHLKYVDRLKRDYTKLYWLVKNKEGLPLGCINLNPIDWEKREAYLGIFKNPNLGKVGFTLLSLLIDISKHIFQLRKLKLEVLSSNERAINLYLKMHFVKVGEKKRGGRKFLIFEKEI